MTDINHAPAHVRLEVLRAAGENIRGTKLWHKTLAEVRANTRYLDQVQVWTGREA